ncbi:MULTISPECIES: exopolysaccharide biosynthesis polyprenyl glycosylphosphotransferase [unclassified Streptomyces]|uniref:exopolysaccharide biosynthesis polyprenyl glycosylphosphotransferase n=1 Tax=unclassified Streptomyces TaxID=2593676 RepID=UPI00081BAD95|nr:MULTISPECIES: exopolysaccharide biosynthesis polyprenyl glycosylphosphotransferase [unclassified Streptomyces]SCE40164.1 exopolysaccharide biosynthesis polyprenyl glycosylphosphotransferase [Streptomyces sp. PalvLS-984]SDB87593.1 exopolysaccharide biosynthesis polyprenyl glycosylphosphotransferase [Streptomyces sp. AmelKG-A3]
MGHVDLPESGIPGPVGLAGAPRQRTAAPRARTPALGPPRSAPRVRSGRPPARPAAGRPARRPPLLALTDLLGLGVPAGWVLHAAGVPGPPAAAAVAGLAWTGVRAARGRYADPRTGRPGSVAGPLGDWLVLVGALVVLLAVTGRRPDPATAVLALTPGLVVALAAAGAARWRARTGAVRRVLVVGEAAGLDRAVGRLTSATGHPYAVVAAVPVGEGTPRGRTPVPGRLAPEPADDDVSTVLGGAYAHDADLVLVAPGPRLTGDRLRRLSWGLHDGGIALGVLSELSGTAAGRVRPASAAGLTLLHVTPPLRHGPQAVLKALVDRSGAALGLLALAPLFLAVALAVRLSSRGPVFHRQIRHGRHNRPFTMWKFRTMVEDAESRKEQLAPANESEGPMFKMRRDPRVTRIGHALRRTSVDELPQLLNVLRGDMSLVGPRPPLPDEAARYDERELRRLAVRPGLTGLWQVSGRSDLTWQETVRLDLWYVDNWSLAMDLGLLARTVRAVADGRGAY